MSYIFIGGCARSGTTALRRVLATGQNVVIGIERYLGLKDKPDLFTPELFAEERFYELRPGETWYDTLDQFSYYQSTKPTFQTATAVGDKIPMLNNLFPAIHKNFTDARVVFIVRNLFDVANSYQVRANRKDDPTWPTSRDYRRACQDWNETLTDITLWSQRLSMIVIDYESFFAGSARIPYIAKFLGLNADTLNTNYENELQRELPTKSTPELSAIQKQYIAETGNFTEYRAALKLARRTKFPGLTPHDRKLETSPKYQKEDIHIANYNYTPYAERLIRGPAPQPNLNNTIVALGAASTFGRFISRPFVETTANALQMQPLNLGYGGARAPLFYLNRKLMNKINSCALAVLEICSARGTGTPSAESRDHVTTFLRRRGSEDDFVFAQAFYSQLSRRLKRHDLLAIVRDIQKYYTLEMQELLRQIKIPKILVWFSQRSPDLVVSDVPNEFTGTFPHFVNRKIVRELAAKSDDYIELVSTTGLPNELRDLQTGQPVNLFPNKVKPCTNDYYPSQEMHDELAELLTPAIRKLLPPS